MKCRISKLLLLGVIGYLSSVSLNAQDNYFSQDLIIGKWILKSALFNGTKIAFGATDQDISFEFLIDGKVVFISSEGEIERGNFVIKENKLIDPDVPEYPNADILSLTKNALVLLIKKEEDRVKMTFEPVADKN